jgi:hypothetical protein
VTVSRIQERQKEEVHHRVTENTEKRQEEKTEILFKRQKARDKRQKALCAAGKL